MQSDIIFYDPPLRRIKKEHAVFDVFRPLRIKEDIWISWVAIFKRLGMVLCMLLCLTT
jgi:hypothetical protein